MKNFLSFLVTIGFLFSLALNAEGQKPIDQMSKEEIIQEMDKLRDKTIKGSSEEAIDKKQAISKRLKELSKQLERVETEGDAPSLTKMTLAELRDSLDELEKRLEIVNKSKPSTESSSYTAWANYVGALKEEIAEIQAAIREKQNPGNAPRGNNHGRPDSDFIKRKSSIDIKR